MGYIFEIDNVRNEQELERLIEKMKAPVQFLEGIFEKIDITKPFEYKLHKDNFPYYLEVIITQSGEIKYAVPSHLDAIRKYAIENNLIAKENIEKYTFDDFINITNCIGVWTEYYRGRTNDKQISTLQSLKDYGIYLGGLNAIDSW